MLSDPQERAWYDSHRDSVLRDDDGATGDNYENNVRLTTSEDVLHMFKKFNTQVDFTGSTTGFYCVLRETFNMLAREEQAACEWEGVDRVHYPSFGHADDDYEVDVKSFYAIWSSFTTQKTFSWKDIYKCTEAPDRRIRRLMEKENKRLRDEGIREFNDAVRSLVAFVKKRDPRFKSSQQSETERQKVVRDAASAQAARSRAANQTRAAQSDVFPEWMRSSEPPNSETSDGELSAAPKHEFECIVCWKTFKSEKQYEAHERSKKHLKAVRQVYREMRRDIKDIDFEMSASSSIALEPSVDKITEEADVSTELTGSDQRNGFAYIHDEPEALNEEANSGFGYNAIPSNEEVPPYPVNPFESSLGSEHPSREQLGDRISRSEAKSGPPSAPHVNDKKPYGSERCAEGSLVGDQKRKLGKVKSEQRKPFGLL